MPEQTRQHQNDAVMHLSAADKRLHASLNKTKLATSDYMDTPNKKTEASLSAANAEQVDALQGAGLEKQANEMRKVDQDFRSATPEKKQRIAETLARSLFRVTVAALAAWTVIGAVSAGGVAYALYEINSNGQVEGASDVNVGGEIDPERTDIDEDTELTLVDQDVNGSSDPVEDRMGEGIATDGDGMGEEIPAYGDDMGDGLPFAEVGDDEEVSVIGWAWGVIGALFGDD